MSLEAIREALQGRLAALTPEIGTAWRNRAFSPDPGQPWQSVDMLPLAPDDAEIGAAGHWERGILQVTLRYPLNAGPGALDARAWLMARHFRRGLTFAQDGVTVHITRAPVMGPEFTALDRFCKPISIYWHARVLTP